MTQSQALYQTYIEILKEELIPAMGCTEPIALAYAAAKAREILGHTPERLDVAVSGNILKNVKSVIVPRTNGLRGVAAAVAVGALAGDASKELEVLSCITDEQLAALPAFIEQTSIHVALAETDQIFDVMITAYAGNASAFVRLAGHHTNIVCIQKNNNTLFESPVTSSTTPDKNNDSNRSTLSIKHIVQFADEVCIEDVRSILESQIQCNMAIAEEGLRNDYGANIGKVLLVGHDDILTYKVRAYAAAASDARMSGCNLPVIINSGSGNQGITASVPVIVYAQEEGFSHEQLLRALCVSNLVTIHLKTGIGCLSAYCGVVSAGCGAAAGIAWLKGGGFDSVAHTIVNTLATSSGIICDGAKASCAAKISSAVDAGLLGLSMYEQGNQFYGGDGIVKKGVEHTIANISHIAREGMAQTDQEIIRLMLEG